MAPLAEAFVRIRPDTDSFRREFGRDMDRAGQQAQRAGADAGEEYGQRFTRGVDGRLRDHRGRFIREMQATGAEGGAAAGEAGGEEMSGGIFEKLKGLAAAAGLGALGSMIGAKLMEGIGEAMERESIVDLMGAQLGSEGARVGELGKLAGEIYAENFGESFKDVADGLRDVIRSNIVDSDATDDMFKKTTEQAITLAQILEEDVGSVTRAVSKMLRTGLAKDAQEAFDILTVGAQQGANMSEDLLDTFNEYSTTFRTLGIDGKTAMGLIAQGLQAGARDADLVADAFKEIGIRLQDGSAAEALKKLGLNAEQMRKAIVEGGPGATAALDQILDKLRAFPDEADRYAIAQELLGTQSEDLAEALMALDPSKATELMGDFAGATDKAMTAIGDNAKGRIDSFKRTLETQFVNFLGDTVLPKISAFVDDLNEFKGSFEPSPGMQKMIDRGRELFDDVLPRGKELLDHIKDSWDRNKEGIDKLGDAAARLLPVVGVLAKVGFEYLKFQIDLVITTLGVLGTAWDFMSKLGAKAVKLLADYFFDKMGFILQVAIKAFGWIPGLGDKLKAAGKGFEDFRVKVNNELDKILDEDVNVNVRYNTYGTPAKNHQVQGATIGSGNLRFNRFGGLYMAAAGLVNLDGAANIFPAGRPMYGFAEEGTGGEAFIARNAPRRRSLAIASAAARWHGASVVPNEALGGGQAPTTVQVIIDGREIEGATLRVVSGNPDAVALAARKGEKRLRYTA